MGCARITQRYCSIYEPGTHSSSRVYSGPPHRLAADWFARSRKCSFETFICIFPGGPEPPAESVEDLIDPYGDMEVSFLGLPLKFVFTPGIHSSRVRISSVWFNLVSLTKSAFGSTHPA